MKKITNILLLVFLSVVLISGTAYAVSGQCANCHTMHYSQNGTILSDWGTEGPYGHLLLASCVGCHTGPSVPKNTHDAPVVLRTTDPTGQGGTLTLAGGDFWWVAQGSANDTLGHNVADITGVAADSNMPGAGLTPPGWDPTATPGGLSDGQIAGGEDPWTVQLKCAGQYGCHGNHTDLTADDGIKGSHHTNTGGSSNQCNVADTVGNSYRFLGGIKGLEHSEWNYNETSSIHNEYYGVDGNAAYAEKTTISYSCAQCHGIFHSSIGSGSPWLRHPTDIVLPSTGEYSNYNPDGAGAYSVEAPVGRPTIPSSSGSLVIEGDSTTDNGAIVMCISCHRAHGSPEPDILRWTYSGMVAGSGTSDTGCFTCHTTKNAD